MNTTSPMPNQNSVYQSHREFSVPADRMMMAPPLGFPTPEAIQNLTAEHPDNAYPNERHTLGSTASPYVMQSFGPSATLSSYGGSWTGTDNPMIGMWSSAPAGFQYVIRTHLNKLTSDRSHMYRRQEDWSAFLHGIVDIDGCVPVVQWLE
jgi:hypothetical protein